MKWHPDEMKDCEVTFEGLEWHPDEAASGLRYRAWLDRGEMLAYEAGDWMVSIFVGEDERRNVSTAVGHEADVELAKARAFAVYEAMTRSKESEKVKRDPAKVCLSCEAAPWNPCIPNCKGDLLDAPPKVLEPGDRVRIVRDDALRTVGSMATIVECDSVDNVVQLLVDAFPGAPLFTHRSNVEFVLRPTCVSELAFSDLHPDDVLDVRVHLINDICTWLSETEHQKQLADRLHENRNRFLLAGAKPEGEKPS